MSRMGLRRPARPVRRRQPKSAVLSGGLVLMLGDMLVGCGTKFPETGLDQADEGKQVEFDSSIQGVLTADEVKKVASKQGTAFTRSWLTLLTAHEKGAVELAQHELDAGQNERAMELANKDLTAHQQRVDAMQRMLSR
jgi:hypothetical protein